MVAQQAARSARQTYTVAEMATLYGIGRATAYRMAQRDEFPVKRIKLGDRIVFRRTEVWRDLGLTEDPLPPDAWDHLGLTEDPLDPGGAE